MSSLQVGLAVAGGLILGGVIGAQIGAQLAMRLKAEQLRILLALLVLSVCLKLTWDLVAPPDELFSIAARTTG